MRILSVGRLVEKKGFDDLLGALATLTPALAWTLDIVGGGALEARLRRKATALGIGERVRWHGSLPHDRVVEHFAGADLFALASRIGADGDRDGLPNVLMEAQLLGAACVATRVSGTPELIEHEVNGLLVTPRDTGEMAGALERAMADPGLRGRLAEAGRRVVTTRFSFEDGIARIAARLAAASHPAPRPDPRRLAKSASRHREVRTFGAGRQIRRCAAGISVRLSPHAESRGRPRAPRTRIVRIAYYAPLKAPDHPTASGDRLIAGLLARALEHAGHEVVMASRLRAFDGAGDRSLQLRLARTARAQARGFSTGGTARPELPSAGSPITSITRRPTGSGRA